MKSLLDNGHSLVIQLRNRATIVENDAIDQMKKKIFVQKLKDALLHLKTALHIARDADLKLGLCDGRESLKVWNDIDIIYNNLELRSDGRENNVNDIVIVCDELEIMFDKFQ